MNPYIPFNIPKQPNPPIVMTVSHANSVLNQFNAERAVEVGNHDRALENLEAVIDVLTQRHPELAGDIQTVSFWAQLVGETDATISELGTMQNQYRSALPADIKSQLGGQ